MAKGDADRNLLFGILALNLDFITRDALVAAMHAWLLDKRRPLGEILVDQGAMAAGDRAMLEPMVARHVERHGDDVSRSLTAIGVEAPVREALASIPDGDLTTSLASLGPDRDATVVGDSAPAATGGDGSVSSAGGRFRVLRPHARGGLGAVFVAVDEELGREVALKQIRDEHADDPTGRARFVAEAEITGRLEHPGVIPVYGLGRHPDGRPFYAMRLIRGASLKEAIAEFHAPDGPGDGGERTLALRKLLRRFLDVCDAVAYAHSRGVLHRDLKPANVMVGPYGETLVVDWGLAKVVGRPDAKSGEGTLPPTSSGGSAETLPGSAVGTPAYMSPEQARGDVEALGSASDVYSLGATLYCLLTGRPPLEGPDVAVVMERVRRAEFPSPREVDRRVPRALDAICRKAMAGRPEDRYASPRGLADDLEHWLADEPVEAHREGWLERLGRWDRRHRPYVRAGLAASVFALAVLAVSLASVFGAWRREGGERRRAEEALARNNLALAGREFALGDRDRAMDLLEQCAERFRGWEWNLLRRQCDGVRATFRGHSGAVLDAAFSPDGTRVASVGDDLTVRVWDAATGRPILALEGHADGLLGVAYRPDGRRIASCGRDGTVRVWDADDGRPLLRLRGHEGPVAAVAYRPDGRQVAGAGWDGTVRVWDADDGRQIRVLPVGPEAPIDVAYSADGRHIVAAAFSYDVPTGRSSGRLVVWEAEGGEELWSRMVPEAWASRVVLHPDGRRVGVAGLGARTPLWETATGREAGVLSGAPAGATRLTFGDAGRRLAASPGLVMALGHMIVSASPVRGTVELVVGEAGQSLRAHADVVTALEFGPGGALLSASLDGTVRVWDTADGAGPPPTFRAHAGAFTRAAFSADGRRVLGRAATQMRSWDAATGDLLRAVDCEPERVADLGGDSRTLILKSVGEEFPALDGGGDFSADGSRFAAVAGARALRVHDTATGEVLLQLDGEGAPLHQPKFSPDGRLVVAVRGEEPAEIGATSPAEVLAWDAASGRLLHRVPTEMRPLLLTTFSPDGRRLAVSSSNGWDLQRARPISVFDTAAGRPLRPLEGHTGYVMSIAFSPDGRRLAGAGVDTLIHVWDVEDGGEVLSLRGHTAPVNRVAFSPDGARIASAASDGTVRVWDAATGRPRHVLRGHASVQSAYPMPLAFSPDGRRLATTRNLDYRNRFDLAELKVWDVETGRELASIPAHARNIEDLAFDPDGDRLLTASQDGTVKLWDARPRVRAPRGR